MDSTNPTTENTKSVDQQTSQVPPIQTTPPITTSTPNTDQADTVTNQNQPDTSEQPTKNYATIGKRVMANFVDGVILGIAGFVVTVPFSYGPTLTAQLTNDPGLLQAAPATSVIAGVLTWIINIAYPVYFIGKKGATPGKSAMKIKVVKKDSPDTEIGYGGAFIRETVGKLFSILALGLGYLWALWDKDKQAWHDKIANTVVVNVEEKS